MQHGLSFLFSLSDLLSKDVLLALGGLISLCSTDCPLGVFSELTGLYKPFLRCVSLDFVLPFWGERRLIPLMLASLVGCCESLLVSD